MSESKKKYSNTATGKFVATKVRTLEKQYKVDFNVPANTNVSTYLTNSGAPSLAKSLTKIEKYIAELNSK